MDILNRIYTAQAVALAAGTTSKQITDWCNLGRILGQREPLGRGHSRKFSWSNVMEVAIALELIEAGLCQVQEAFAAAQTFAHFSEAPLSILDNTPEREVGLPWHQNLGQTFLLIWNSGNAVILTDYAGTVKLSINPHFDGKVTSFLAVNVSEVFKRVCDRMGLDYRVVLDEAYQGEAD